MKILLIEPAKAPLSIGGEDVYIFESLALEYIAAGVESHHDVRMLDMRLDKNLSAMLTSFCPDVVGLTSYTVHVNTVRSLCKQIKSWEPKTLTVVGGHHATVAPDDFLSPFIDVVVMGEGVFAFQEIIACFDRGVGFEGVPGVAFERDEALVHTEPHGNVELDSLPFPDRTLTTKYRPHYHSEWMKPLASIRTSRGCSFRCSFCSLWKTTGGCYLTRSPERIVEELATIDEKFVFFADDESLLDVSRMQTLAERIRASGIRKQYYLYGRSDTIAKNPKLLETWREVGLKRIFVGFEFVRDSDLEFVGKGTTSHQNNRAIEILHALGIEVYASFMLRPEFDHEDFAALRQYCRDLRLRFAGFSVLTPLPGTDFYEDVKDRMITHNHDYFDLIHTLLPTTLPLKEFYEQYYRLLAFGVSPREKFAFMLKYRPRDMLPTIAMGMRFYNRLRKAYRDYEHGTDVFIRASP